MAFAKRIFLFLAVNILILITISVTLTILGVRPYLSARGIDYGALMVFCVIWGFAGAFISLALSRVMAKWMMGVKVIDPNTSDPAARELLNTVHNLAQAAGLPKLPQVGIYDSPEVNAFATGPTRSRALVAVSTGILRSMDRRALEGVLGHEITHIANGDMVTMALVQGVVNAFVLFLSRVLAFAISQMMRGDRDRGPSYLINGVLSLVFDIVFSILGSMVVAAFSRQREFRADAGGARLAGVGSMIGALEALQRNAELVDTQQRAFATLKIAGKRRSGLMMLFATHPPLEVRIDRLRQMG
jgi:heat shock protein HtpX